MAVPSSAPRVPLRSLGSNDRNLHLQRALFPGAGPRQGEVSWITVQARGSQVSGLDEDIQAKLKTALLGHAQVLQRAQQEATQVVSTFAERWMQAALR